MELKALNHSFCNSISTVSIERPPLKNNQLVRDVILPEFQNQLTEKAQTLSCQEMAELGTGQKIPEDLYLSVDDMISIENLFESHQPEEIFGATGCACCCHTK